MKENPKPYEWDYNGACIPDGNPFWKTFSVGIFQWLPKSNGKGLKKGKIVKRIKGSSYEKEAVFKLARIEVANRTIKGKDRVKEV